MSAFTGSDLADFLYYKKLPPLYRNKDAEEGNLALYRYLHACIEGGFNDFLEQAAKMTDLIDPWKCPAEYLPYLYASFGLPYFEDIGEYYNRRFLSNVGELLKRRGTIGGIRYLVRTLTGMESEINYRRETEGEEQGRYLDVFPHFPDVTSLAEVEVTSYTINRFLDLHVPFYIRTIFFPYIETQYIESRINHGTVFADSLTQYLFKERERILYHKVNRGINLYSEISNNLISKDKVQDIFVYLKQRKPIKLKYLEYNLTGMFGTKLPIVNWTTRGNFSIPVINKYIKFMEYYVAENSLLKEKVHKLYFPIQKTTTFLQFQQFDLKKEEKSKALSLNVIKGTLMFNDSKVYDLTNLKGYIIPLLNTIKKEQDMKTPFSKLVVYTFNQIFDLTFIEGKRFMLGDRFNRRYNLNKKTFHKSLITDYVAYNLQKEVGAQKMIGGLRKEMNIVSVVEYNLKG